MPALAPFEEHAPEPSDRADWTLGPPEARLRASAACGCRSRAGCHRSPVRITSYRVGLARRHLKRPEAGLRLRRAVQLL
jgi:hypothetical protein